MSLRAQIHAALGDVTPPAPDLQRRVVAYVIADDRDRVVLSRRRGARWTKPLRGTLGLVAAVLIVVLMAGIVIGGRLLADWNGLHKPAPGSDTYHSQLAALESRPLNLPLLQPDAACNRGPFNADNSALGAGPLYWYRGSAPTSTAWGRYYSATVYTDEHITGPILVRARDLYSNSTVMFVGQFATGTVAGTDVLLGSRMSQHTEVVINERDAPRIVTNPPASPHAFVWQFTYGFAGDWSGRAGWQIDAAGFSSEVFLSC
ncbi:MAG TPA: hypothetical protein VJQ08_05915 [Candidatus Dormibacteraeota bacterium]|nr:hypothetical protein [Candidatus Dormibacteraeota bacterium]